MALQIKEVLKSKGISVQELADKLGINRVSLSYQLNGNPTVETLTKIATAIGVDISELFEQADKGELTALIYHQGDYYNASTLSELEGVLNDIKTKGPF